MWCGAFLFQAAKPLAEVHQSQMAFVSVGFESNCDLFLVLLQMTAGSTSACESPALSIGNIFCPTFWEFYMLLTIRTSSGE